MSRTVPTLSLAILALAAGAARAAEDAPPAGVSVVDSVVAVVGERVVTASDVRLERELRAHDPSPVPVLEARRDDPLGFLVELALLRGVAGDIALYRPAEAEVQARLARLRRSFDGPEDWRAFLARNGLDEGRLAAALRSRMVVERLVRRTLGEHPAGDPEALRRYEAWVAELRRTVPVRRVPAEPAGGEAGP